MKDLWRQIEAMESILYPPDTALKSWSTNKSYFENGLRKEPLRPTKAADFVL